MGALYSAGNDKPDELFRWTVLQENGFYNAELNTFPTNIMKQHTIKIGSGRFFASCKNTYILDGQWNSNKVGD